MIHPMYRSDGPSGHLPFLAISWLAGAMLLFGGAAHADRLVKDPVEKFRQTLLAENDKRLDDGTVLKGEALEKSIEKRTRDLRAAAKNLSLSDLSRVLFLLDWPLSEQRAPDEPNPGKDKKATPEVRSLEVVEVVRKGMVERFNKEVTAGLKDPAKSAAFKIALANLVGETIQKSSEQFDSSKKDDKLPPKKDDPAMMTRLSADIDFAGFAEQLGLITKDKSETSDRVRIAAAGTLGQFSQYPKTAGPALKRLLSSDYSEPTRLAAASALVNLGSSIAPKVSLKGSEPGVSLPEARFLIRPFSLEETLEVVMQVTDAASVGLEDSSVAVRRQSIAAIRAVASEVALKLRTLPDKGRLQAQAKTLDDYRKYTAALSRAIRDSDDVVRVEALRALADLAHIRLALRDLVGTPPVKPMVDDLDLSRLAPAKGDRIRLTAGVNSDTPSVLPAIGNVSRLPKLNQAPAAKSDGITELLNRLGSALAEDGLRDTNVTARRAAHEAIEALGDDAVKYAPQLAKSLEDSDLFVRWITARTLRKIAEEDERQNRTSQSTDVVIPALVKGLEDEDLDGRTAMTRALGAYGPAAKDAVPDLAKRLAKGDVEYRVVVLKALEGIGTDSKEALPEIVAGFQDKDSRLRVEAARVVGQLHEFAAPYLDDLEKLTRDPDPKVRETAGAAILRIRPK